jgi:hypothetical protein
MRPRWCPNRYIAARGRPSGGDKKEAVAALGHSVGIQYAVVVVMLGIGVFTFWLLRVGYSIRELSARTAHGVSGYLRTSPDPWLEGTLRTAFAEFDRELALILKERSYTAPAATDKLPQDPAAPPGR